MSCKVAVGSKNPVKVQAVRRAMRLVCEAEVYGFEVDSGVPKQPCGVGEIVYGALNRAINAAKLAGDVDYSVGIEAGIYHLVGGLILDVQAAVIVTRDRRVSVGFSQAFLIPGKWVKQLLEGVELADIASSQLRRPGIKERLGLIGYLTLGQVTRTELSQQAVVMALVPIMNRDLYGELPSLDEFRKAVELFLESDRTCPRKST